MVAGESSFKDFVETEVGVGIEKAALGVNEALSATAVAGALDNSRSAFPVAKAIDVAANDLLVSLMAGYERALLLGREKRPALRQLVREGLEKFERLTAKLGLQHEAFPGGRNELLAFARVENSLTLRRRLDNYFAGYTAPLRPHWVQRHPILFAIFTIVTSSVLGGVAGMLTRG